ncbi:MAG: hypothetical protein JOZ05_09135 [Acetobacteraceae bacterium]|nr:hypothetical protein [Acetobacteraceae bacterium]
MAPTPANLASVLATLLPAEPPFPSGALVAETVAADLGADGLALLAELPPNFAAGDEGALRKLEAQFPEVFDRLVRAAYLAYYTNPDIRRVLEQVAGYPARPPQPLGYELPPFDDAMLDRQRRAPPIWREPG